MNLLFQILYCLFAKWLPRSRRCRLFRSLRGWFFRRIAIYGGKNINIEHGASFNHWVSLGDESGIGVDCEMNAIGPKGIITIGNHVMMGPEVVIYTRNHAFSRCDIPIMEQGFREPEPVTIGNDVWIGRRAIILPGVTVGDGCVIGAGAVVTKSVPPYSVAVGVPANVIHQRGS